ncbi:MAG: Ppx/GppA family phosphatase [Rhodospirillaceae bacterium]|nr:Ppx/GppA family phosphatase [Rhodospirillaceae bacterium]
MTDDPRPGVSPAPAAVCPGGNGGSLAPTGSGQVFAAIDLGTNSCRMLVARHNHAESGRPDGAHPDGPRPENPRAENARAEFRVIDSFSRITRLGEGVSGSGRLSDDAMDRTIDALKCCADKMDRRRVSASRQVATEACRRAANCSEFLDRVTRETGLALEIISAEEEATLALKGCAALLDFDIPYALIFDIGGGSTEVLFVQIADARNIAVQGCISLPMGVVTVAEDCGGGDLCGRTYQAVSDRVQKLLEPFEAVHGIRDKIAAGVTQMIGTSGTVTTLGGLHLGLNRYDRAAVDGLMLDFDALHATSQALCAKTLQQRAAEPCIGWQRADLMLAGCAILEAICRMWPVGRLKVADRGLREGLLMNLIHPSTLRVEPGRMHPASARTSPLQS